MRVLAGHHEGAQVALARAHLTGFGIDHIDVLELDDLLRDETARFGLDAIGHLLTLRLVERRSEDYAVASGLGNVLDDELSQPVKHFLAILLEHRHIGRRVLQNRLFTQIVTNHGRYEIVDGLVIGSTIAGGVHDGDVAGTVCR